MAAGMSDLFFSRPILNSPYEYPRRHWALDETGQPTGEIVETRRPAKFVTPIPKPKKQKRAAQKGLEFADVTGVSSEAQKYDPTPIIAELRAQVDKWRALPRPDQWMVTPETARLLQHWRTHPFSAYRPFFCQVEAAETAIWLTEVAPEIGKAGQRFLDHLRAANDDANPGLSRLALKLATGAGKTTVMAMLIAWQTINAVRRPNSKRFTRGFLVVSPGITIRDRLRVLLPNDPDSYYRTRELVPGDLLREVERAKIVITNFQALKRRETLEISKGGRALLQGRGGAPIQTLETEGQMLQRVAPELMGLKNILAINDEGHHCYREKPDSDEDQDLKGEEKHEAEKNREAARLWINGLEAVQRKLGLLRIFDLSATPFFLRGSGYAEGTLFPWTMTDFSLMDAIESGIVKLPRVPVADNKPGGDMPMYRNLWEHIGKKLPKKGRGKASSLDPLSIPQELETALQSLYGHYEKTFSLWKKEGIDVPPCFIVVCNNTSTSKLVYDYISGFWREDANGKRIGFENGRLKLFRNFGDDGEPLARPHTLLIDSEQLESGEALDDNFRDAAAHEIERFRREIRERTGDLRMAENLTDQDLLREVMNTVGKKDRLGGQTRCVVSVSMLTEGWDANTVTHVLGVRAFGTQLLCEQVIGRALRRQSYDLNEDGKFNVEYADVLGIPFDFTAKPVVVKPQPPRETVQVRAVSPERDRLEIRFPRVEGYRVELPAERLEATFDADSTLTLTPELVGPTETRNEGIVGEGVDLTVDHLVQREATIAWHLTKRLLVTKLRDADEEPKWHLFGQLKPIVERWVREHLATKGSTTKAQVLYLALADMACERIHSALKRRYAEGKPVTAVLDAFNPVGSTRNVRFATSKKTRWKTDPRKSHIDWVVWDSEWEAQFCRAVEKHPRVFAYAKNHNLGFEVPYRYGSVARRYRPDFLVLVDDGAGPGDLLHLVVEIKGLRGEDAKEKKAAMETAWVPAVNAVGTFGRWDFVELTDVHEIDKKFAEKIDECVRNAPKPASAAKAS